MPRVVVFWIFILLAPWPHEAVAEARVALVIGNSAYENEARLPNPTRDATAIAELFKKAGFEVVQARNDLGNLEFKRALRDFFDVAYEADIALVYYAGHAIQVGDDNYMIPVDAKLLHEYDAEDEAISLERIVKAVSPAKRLRVVILDACRDNPFAAKMQRRVATRQIASRGLARVEPTYGDTLIAYAAKAGSTAEDGDGEHSPFTTALLKHLAEPGLDIRLAFGRVRDDVLKNTRNTQEPFVYGTLGGRDITLVPAPAAPPQAPAGDLNSEYEQLRKRLDELERFSREKAQGEAEAKRKGDEAQALKEAEAKAKVEAEQARKTAEAEAKRKAEEAQAQKEAKRKADAEQAQKEADAKAEAERARVAAEAEAKRKAAQELAQKEAEAKRKADAERAQKEAEAKARADAEQARQSAEAEAKRKGDAEQAEREAAAKRQAEEEKVAALQPQAPADEALRRGASPTGQQRTDFIMQAQRLLSACKCYSGDINGRADDIASGLSLLIEHRQDARRIELASANVGQFEDWIAWMGGLASEKFTCPEANASKAEREPQAKEQGGGEPSAKRKKTTQQKPSQSSSRKPHAASAPARSPPSSSGSFGPSLRSTR
jgi:uncharacterized caspase-like protein